MTVEPQDRDNEVVDLHCHFMPPDLPDFASQLDDPRWPVLRVREDDEQGKIMRGEALFRVVDRACWNTETRLRNMDQHAITRQVMSPIPVALTYWAERDPALVYARHINDWLAEQVRQADGRVLGLGTVPLQDPVAAGKELERVLALGLAGVEIGTIIGGLELDAPELRHFFHVAEDLHAPIFVHPMARYHGHGIDRCGSELSSFAIEMLTDTTIAATALVFGGVLKECPGLRLCLSHGGGTFTWAYPRLRYWECEQSADPVATGAALDARTASLYVDSLVFDAAHLAVLKERYTVDHLVAGSDYPFVPVAWSHPSLILDQALELGTLSADEVHRVKVTNALEFLNR